MFRKTLAGRARSDNPQLKFSQGLSLSYKSVRERTRPDDVQPWSRVNELLCEKEAAARIWRSDVPQQTYPHPHLVGSGRETSDRPNRTGWWLTHGSCDQHSERSRALVSACEQSLCWFGQVIDAGCSPHGREKPILGTTLAMVGLNDAYPGRRRDQGRFVGKGRRL
jgi:hypothetical protein